MAKRIVLTGLCPEWQGYEELSATDYSEIEFFRNIPSAGQGSVAHEAAIANLLNENTPLNHLLRGLTAVRDVAWDCDMPPFC